MLFPLNFHKIKNQSVVGLIILFLFFNYAQAVKADDLIKREETNFYIFASFSLSDNVIRQMIDYAKIYNGTIVFRGLENNSFRATSEHIQRIVREDDEAAIIIDPTLFTRFQIDQVPSFVLVEEKSCVAQMSCSRSYDKLAGNVTPRFALEKIAEKGELSKEAVKLLEDKR